MGQGKRPNKKCADCGFKSGIWENFREYRNKCLCKKCFNRRVDTFTDGIETTITDKERLDYY